MRTIIILLGLLLPLAVHAQEDPISTVNGTPISVSAFQARYDLERLMLVQEVIGFAELYRAQDEDAPLQNVLTVAYDQQLIAIYNPERFAETILNSMEVDVLIQELAADMTIDENEVDSRIRAHVIRAYGFLDTETTPDVDAVDAAILQFYEDAMTIAGADREAVRDLFRARVLRESVFELVTADVAVPTESPESDALQQRNRAFQEWAFEQQQLAEINRVEDWEQFIPETYDARFALEQALSRMLAN